jgi:hypothetical protein
MAWWDFIDVEFVKLNAKHVSGALVAILGFSLVTWVSERVMHESLVLWLIHILDNIVVSGCIIYLSVVILGEIGRKLRDFLKGLSSGAIFILVA